MCKFSPRIIFLIISLCTYLTIAWPVHAQTSTPPPARDLLIRAIQTRAQQDVKRGLQHETPTDLEILFGDDADAVGMSMNEVVEIYTNAYEAALNARSLQDQLRDLLLPNTGWVVALLLFLWAIFANVIKEYFTRFFKWITEAIYRIFAGLRPFWMFSLRRYRKSLERTYREHKIAFRPDRPLKMQEIYVPFE